VRDRWQTGSVRPRHPARSAGAIAPRCAKPHAVSRSSMTRRSPPSGLKTTQRAILAELGRSERTTVGELAEALVMDPGALAHTLKPLERDGLIAVAVDPDDRRNRLITLTRRGRTKLAETDCPLGEGAAGLRGRLRRRRLRGAARGAAPPDLGRFRCHVRERACALRFAEPGEGVQSDRQAGAAAVRTPDTCESLVVRSR